MASTKQTKWTSDWKRENYERYMLEFPKGTKERVACCARNRGLTMRKYILTLIELDSGIELGCVEQRHDEQICVCKTKRER